MTGSPDPHGQCQNTQGSPPFNKHSLKENSIRSNFSRFFSCIAAACCAMHGLLALVLGVDMDTKQYSNKKLSNNLIFPAHDYGEAAKSL